MSKKKKKGAQGFFAKIVMLLIGGICGLAMTLVGAIAFKDNVGFVSFFVEIAFFVLTYFIHLIIHEAGHLVAGLLSGYEFSSFRVMNLMLVKENGKIKLKKQSVAGTGGQCLMIPPALNGGDYPVIFYNLGGVIMNLIITAISVALAVIFVEIPMIFFVCSMMALSGLVVALTNGIPLKLGMINNDGSNARELYKNTEAKIAFHNQFMIIGLLSSGVRLRDMDEELFPMPSEEGMQNSISISSAVFRENRLMDKGEFDAALEVINKLTRGKNALIGLYKNLLIADKITILLLKQENTAMAEKYYTCAEYVAFKKQMGTNISVLRTDYAYLLLHEKNEGAASVALSKFEERAKSHPYKPDIESEREIIALINGRYDEIK